MEPVAPAPPALTADDCIQMARLNLDGFARAVATAVDLFTLLERGGGPPSSGVFGGVFIEYRMIAAKDAALNIFHFGKSLESIEQCAEQSEIGQKYIEKDILKSAIAQFDADFSNINSIRNAIAHAGEHYDSVPKLRTSVARKRSSHPGGEVVPGMIMGLALSKERSPSEKEANPFPSSSIIPVLKSFTPSVRWSSGLYQPTSNDCSNLPKREVPIYQHVVLRF